MEKVVLSNPECTKAKNLKNVIYFLASENVIIGEDIQKELSKCYLEVKRKKFVKSSLKKKSKEKSVKLILSLECPEDKKEEALKINFDNKVLYAYPIN